MVLPDARLERDQLGDPVAGQSDARQRVDRHLAQPARLIGRTDQWRRPDLSDDDHELIRLVLGLKLGSVAMPELIETPVSVEAAGQPPKVIDEFVGRASNGEERVSMARMRSPAGWSEPGQRPEFDEYTVVLGGALHVESEAGARLAVSAEC